jgi:hypothetical protein
LKFKSKIEVEPIDISKQISSRSASVTITQNDKYSHVGNYGHTSSYLDQDFYPQTPVTIDSIITDDHVDENFNTLCSFDNVKRNGK